MSTQSGLLRGPQADAAAAVVERALGLTRDEAIALSQAYELDPNENYLAHCSLVQDILDMTGRGLSMGWFEQVFAAQEWIFDTRALDAIADAVMATLVADVIPGEVVEILLRPIVKATPHILPSLVESAG